jgi:translation elongation factor EF-Ts
MSKALENANGDLKAAMESLREKGLHNGIKTIQSSRFRRCH